MMRFGNQPPPPPPPPPPLRAPAGAAAAAGSCLSLSARLVQFSQQQRVRAAAWNADTYGQRPPALRTHSYSEAEELEHSDAPADSVAAAEVSGEGAQADCGGARGGARAGAHTDAHRVGQHGALPPHDAPRGRRDARAVRLPSAV